MSVGRSTARRAVDPLREAGIDANASAPGLSRLRARPFGNDARGHRESRPSSVRMQGMRKGIGRKEERIHISTTIDQHYRHPVGVV